MKIVVMVCRKKKPQTRKEAQHTVLQKAISRSFSKVNISLLSCRKYRFLLALAYAAALQLLPGTQVFAATGKADGGVAIIKLMQMASFWVGIGVVVWGIVEAQLDLPGWKGRITKGIIGYIAILLVPILFLTLRDNLQVDVWQQLDNK
jgi:hypothetical protein